MFEWLSNLNGNSLCGLKAVAAITGIVVLDSVALMNGIDGALLMTSLAAIAGIGGFAAGSSPLAREKIEEAVQKWYSGEYAESAKK